MKTNQSTIELKLMAIFSRKARSKKGNEEKHAHTNNINRHSHIHTYMTALVPVSGHSASASDNRVGPGWG